MCQQRNPQRKHSKNGHVILLQHWTLRILDYGAHLFAATAGLLVTTNLPLVQWTEILGSERLTGAVLDRLAHRVRILEANGESYRLREARNRINHRSSRRNKET